jgi:dienelactone hydrolase
MLMRFFVFFCTASLLGVMSARGDEPPVTGTRARIGRAEALVDALATAHFSSAVEGFNATMKSALPPEKLKENWRGLERQAGAYQRRIGTRVINQNGIKIVFVSCQFDRTVVDVKVAFDNEELIAGLFFVPGKPLGPATRASPPATVLETEVTVGTGKWILPGTLTLPLPVHAKPFAGVVLVHGSGPNDRDESVGMNKPFRDLAWGLAQRGIAVLRYDKRTRVYGAKLGSIHPFTVEDEVVDDARAAVELLRTTAGIDGQRIFVLGHSLGGTLAPRIVTANSSIAGIIIMAGATRKLEDAMLEQARYLMSLNGEISAQDELKLTDLEAQVSKIKKLSAIEADDRGAILGAPPAYWLDLRNYDPVASATALVIPVFVLQGARDYQVTTAEFEDWKKALGAKPVCAFKLYPKLNHLFMAGEGPSVPSEYDQPGHVDESVIADIAEWIGQSKQ